MAAARSASEQASACLPMGLRAWAYAAAASPSRRPESLAFPPTNEPWSSKIDEEVRRVIPASWTFSPSASNSGVSFGVGGREMVTVTGSP